LKVLRLVPLVLILAACSSVKNPLSPYRIDVQQGNALEQESVEKLKPGLSRSQVRFLLGTPLLVDPFHSNRWDYVYNFRKGGKLTEERRLALFFDGEVLARIEAEGFPPKGELPASNSGAAAKSPQKPVESEQPAGVGPAPAADPSRPAEPAKPAPAAAGEPPRSALAMQEQPKPAKQPSPTVDSASPAPVASGSQRSLNETSIVQPLQSDQSKPAKAPGKATAISEPTPAPVTLQAEANVEAIKPKAMPEFPKASAPASPEEQIALALNAWAKAWRTRNEEAYFAAYAASFRPEGGLSREEWEKRRRLLLGVSRNIDLQIEGVATEVVTEDRAQVSFRQFYRSENYQDTVIKQLKFVRVDNLWLIEEERVLTPFKVKK
jgi:outer membrane protein assembly factor BamE